MSVSIITTVTTAAANYNLTTLANAKLELGIANTDTTNDAWLTAAITQVSKAIRRYCNHTFNVEAVSDNIDIQQDPYPYQTPGGVWPLQLKRWPLISVGSVLQTTALNTTITLTLGQDYEVDSEHGWLYRLNPFTGVQTLWEALPLTVPYVSGYGALATESYAVTGGTPSYTVNNAANFSIDQGVVYASSGAALTPVTSITGAGQYSVTSAGVYTFSAADDGATVKPSYGWNQIPEDIVDATLRLVTARYRQKQRDPMLMERTQPGGVGTERYWVPTGQQGAFAPEISGLLDPYRVPVSA